MMNEETPDKSYPQARQEAQKRFEESLSREVRKRVDTLSGNTVERLTANIGDLRLRRHATDILKFLKVAASLRLLLEIETLDQEEHEELDKYISTLHKKAQFELEEENDPETL